MTSPDMNRNELLSSAIVGLVILGHTRAEAMDVVYNSANIKKRHDWCKNRNIRWVKEGK